MASQLFLGVGTRQFVCGIAQLAKLSESWKVTLTLSAPLPFHWMAAQLFLGVMTLQFECGTKLEKQSESVKILSNGNLLLLLPFRPMAAPLFPGVETRHF